MLRQIRRLGADTAVYGIGTVAGRFLNFLLVPFYTNVLAPADYGVVAYLYSLIAFANVVYWYGMESAYFKFAGDRAPAPGRASTGGAVAAGAVAGPAEGAARGAIFATPFLAMLGTSAALSAVLILAREPIAGAIGIPAGLASLVTYSACILFLDAVAVVPFAFLRLAGMSKLFAWIRFLNVLSNVLLNIVLLLRYGMGIEGIFISGVISSGLTLLMLAPVVAGELKPSFHRGLLAAMLRFSLPTVPAGLALMALQVIDRPILKALAGEAAVGIYQANYRLGIFMMIAVSIYDYAWRPFFFSHAGDKDARELFGRIMTYVVMALAALFVAFALFVPEIARWEIGGHYVINPRYWEGLGIVPVVMLGYFFLGISTNLSAGIYIEKKTRYLPFITIAGAAVNIGLNYAMIPRFGIAGAAWATFLAYGFMAAVQYVVARRVYPVEYEWPRIMKVCAVAGGVLVFYLFLPSLASASRVAVKALLVISFPVLLHLAGVFRSDELAALGRLPALLRGRSGSSSP